MPTGYTAAIKDGISFEEFAIRCAGAFGACIMQRDEGASSSLTVDVPSTYYKDQIGSAEARVAKLSAMLPSDILMAYQSAVVEEQQRAEESSKKNNDLRCKYLAMKERVMSWNPPTEEHAELKRFMIEQIDESIRFDCGGSHWASESLSRLKSTTPADWHAAQIDSAKRDHTRALDGWQEELNRTNSRNEWKRQLCESLGVKFGA